MSAISCTQRLSTVARRSTSGDKSPATIPTTRGEPTTPQSTRGSPGKRPSQTARGGLASEARPHELPPHLSQARPASRAPCLLPRARQASRAPCLERALRCAPAHAARPRSCSRSRHSPSAPQRASAPLRAAARQNHARRHGRSCFLSCSALAPAPAPPQRCAVASCSRLNPRRYSVSTALDAAQCAAEDNEGFALALSHLAAIYLSFPHLPLSRHDRRAGNRQEMREGKPAHARLTAVPFLVFLGHPRHRL
jgi:hypothetical protein